MDASWIQHVAGILEYLDARTHSPDGETIQSARSLMESLDAWSFFDRNDQYGLQVQALQILQRICYYDADRGSVADIANWVLERWLRILQRYARSVEALKGLSLTDIPLHLMQC